MQLIAVVIWILLGGIVGGSLASFATLAVERVSARRTILGRSACVCGRTLHPHELIPVGSWLWVGGLASCCGARIPVRYLALEAVGAFAGGWYASNLIVWSLGG